MYKRTSAVSSSTFSSWLAAATRAVSATLVTAAAASPSAFAASSAAFAAASATFFAAVSAATTAAASSGASQPWNITAPSYEVSSLTTATALVSYVRSGM